MNRITLIAFAFLLPIIGFLTAVLLSYLQISYVEKGVPEDSLDDSAVRAGFSYIMFVAAPTLFYVVVSNFIIWFWLVSRKLESLTRLLSELGFVLVFFVTLSIIHLPSCCFYLLMKNKKQF